MLKKNQHRLCRGMFRKIGRSEIYCKIQILPSKLHRAKFTYKILHFFNAKGSRKGCTGLSFLNAIIPRGGLSTYTKKIECHSHFIRDVFRQGKLSWRSVEMSL